MDPRGPHHEPAPRPIGTAEEAARLLGITRRQFFCRCSSGMGVLALASLLKESAFGAEPGPGEAAGINPMRVRSPHFPAKVKRIVFLHMAGAPSQKDDPLNLRGK